MESSEQKLEQKIEDMKEEITRHLGVMMSFRKDVLPTNYEIQKYLDGYMTHLCNYSGYFSGICKSKLFSQFYLAEDLEYFENKYGKLNYNAFHETLVEEKKSDISDKISDVAKDGFKNSWQSVKKAKKNKKAKKAKKNKIEIVKPADPVPKKRIVKKEKKEKGEEQEDPTSFKNIVKKNQSKKLTILKRPAATLPKKMEERKRDNDMREKPWLIDIKDSMYLCDYYYEDGTVADTQLYCQGRNADLYYIAQTLYIGGDGYMYQFDDNARLIRLMDKRGKYHWWTRK